MTDRELMQQALEAMETALETMKEDWHVIDNEYGPSEGGLEAAIDGRLTGYSYFQKTIASITALRARLAQESDMPEQYVMVGRFMLQPHPENGYWLTDTGTCEAMQIFQPEMERVIKDLWKQF